MIDRIKNHVRRSWEFGKAKSDSILGDSHGQALTTILNLVIAGIALVIGVYIFSEVAGQINTTDNSQLDNIIGDIYGAYGMTPIILIVLIAGAIISVLLAFRGRPE
ncbi:hypothetical protein AKJ37_06450 [candidate division MSBL1 archaeon SCGC-AAA259I09]|nr:hypothetical protein AKJ64_04320 [candidate division MSBL1 archaeon SCGC-AAA259E17]KXA92739.1 hypothetical protein AKJ65_07115 [candidate division MSBL1 archaeon SCGC-AAA259E19]KXA94254.1 hypothetical protein AKJ36_03205 [candidate division MSBL1 archaeon SCGC-AAA259I07]KXA95931.1 hypothetical protein AKJ37_06450 [candidate division MSBL1 archaeon SCGC-AAA259I09]KXA99364.1 hypothetical protein AKJ41_05545 [candidate division MSBL1 archaeon SCGC-AAA259O05]